MFWSQVLKSEISSVKCWITSDRKSNAATNTILFQIQYYLIPIMSNTTWAITIENETEITTMKSNPKILLHLAAVCHCNLVPFFVYLMLIRISKLHLYLKPISIAPFAAYTHISCSHYTCRQRNFALLHLPSINLPTVCSCIILFFCSPFRRNVQTFSCAQRPKTKCIAIETK